MGRYKIQKRRTSTTYRKRTSTRYRKGRVGDNLLLDYWNLLLDVNLERRVKLQNTTTLRVIFIKNKLQSVMLTFQVHSSLHIYVDGLCITLSLYIFVLSLKKQLHGQLLLLTINDCLTQKRFTLCIYIPKYLA